MTVRKPFPRTCRQFVNGSYSEGGKWRYITDTRFASSPQQYIRAFLLIQKDLLNLFDYVEPSDKNAECYSYRMHELLIRACVEVEANCKAILNDNGYVRRGDWNMEDYRKLNRTHRLSSYQVKFPLWHGAKSVVSPFAPWATGGCLAWYQAYNATKHDRHGEFETANFGNLVQAIAGLVALLGAQFHTQDFSGIDYLIADGPADGFEPAIGSYFLIMHADDWPAADRYEFDWEALKSDPNAFQQLAF